MTGMEALEVLKKTVGEGEEKAVLEHMEATIRAKDEAEATRLATQARTVIKTFLPRKRFNGILHLTDLFNTCRSDIKRVLEMAGKAPARDVEESLKEVDAMVEIFDVLFYYIGGHGDSPPPAMFSEWAAGKFDDGQITSDKQGEIIDRFPPLPGEEEEED
jgi:hypothetical protein